VNVFIAANENTGKADELEAMIVLPKNAGLRKLSGKFLDKNPSLRNCKIIEVRGEDVPFWVSQLISKGRQVIGFTGEDLYQDYILRNGASDTKVIEKIEWHDDGALYKKPALCFMGPAGKSFDKLPTNMTICACGKYKGIVKSYLKDLEQKGHTITEIYVNGSVETSCSEGIADAVVDIVYSGKSVKDHGLKIYDVIFKSDCVVIGGKND